MIQQTKNVQTLTDELLQQIIREQLQGWPLYKPEDYVSTQQFPDGGKGWWVGYCERVIDLVPFTAGVRMAELPPSLFNLNIKGDVSYILFIQVNHQRRGQGHGEKLYEVCERIAKEAGCRRIYQTPSGGYDDQTRLDYLLKRGWLPDRGYEVYKTL